MIRRRTRSSMRDSKCVDRDGADDRPRTFSGIGVAALTSLVSTAGFALFLSQAADQHVAEHVGDLAILTASLWATLSCARAAARSRSGARGWALLAVAAAIWSIGQTIWTVYGFSGDHSLGHVYPFPSAADIGYLGYAVPAVAALIFFSKQKPAPRTDIRATLDGLLVGAAILCTSWALVLGPVYRGDNVVGFAGVIGIAYPIVDVTIVSMVLILAVRHAPGARLPWVLLTSGLMTLAITDNIYVSLTLRGETGLTGSILSVGWVVAFQLLGLAALAAVRPAESRRTRDLSVAGDLLPYVPVVGVVAVIAGSDPLLGDPFLLWSSAALLLLVAVRQVLFVRDKAALAIELEKRVDIRTGELQRVRDDLQQAFDKAPIGMAWAEMNGVLVSVNPVFCQMLGRTRDELIGMRVRDITFAEDMAATELAFAQAAASPEATLPRFEKRYRHADGHAVWCQVDLLVTKDADKNAKYLVAQAQDISDRRRATRDLADQATFLEAVLENVDSCVVACDAEANLTVFNRASRELHGVPAQGGLPRGWTEKYSLFRSDGITALPMDEIPLYRALSGELVRNAEMVVAANEDDPRTLVVNGHSLLDADGGLLGAVVTMQDVTARRKAEAALSRQAMHDPLTDLPNRVLLRDRLELAIARQSRRPEPLALLLLDLDGFKVVNDSLGHQAGDLLLFALAERLRTCMRPYDTIARLGGDEFAVVLESTSEEQARAIAEQILAVVREPIAIHGRSIASDASVGIMISTGAETPESLLRNADLAMYAAKDLGRGNVQVFKAAMHETVLRRLTLDGELREAIEKEQFSLVYQPIVSLITGRLQGFEALVRWNHPERGIVGPATFIPLAEATGLIVPLGQMVLREACRQARAWQQAHADASELTMSVNLSVRQLQDPAILEVISSALADAGLPAAQLYLEITESVLDQRALTLPLLDSMHATGVRLALDDFGAGYSSLGRMYSLPIDKVKIDKSYVDVLADGNPAPMVAASIAMAHSLGLQTVAEGVESADQLPFLLLHGCDEVQGYLFGGPQTATAISRLLRVRGIDTSWTSAFLPDRRDSPMIGQRSSSSVRNTKS